jgi:hypothetical protein
MAGYWKGSGRVEFTEGQSEALVCKAYYRSMQPVEQLSIALFCANSAMRIELRAMVIASGSNLSGSWEERSFNTNGTITGEATANAIALSVTGEGFSAAMQVQQSELNQKVLIAAHGSTFKQVSVSLTRNSDGPMNDRATTSDGRE